LVISGEEIQKRFLAEVDWLSVAESLKFDIN
jgi:hypothetical protein